MTLDTADLVKLVVGCVSAGGGFAVVKPFAVQLFEWWLSRAKTEADIRDRKELAIVRLAEQHERIVGLFEVNAGRLDRIDARLDRVESHLGIPLTPSAVPSPPPPAPSPRRQLTDPSIAQPTAPPPAQAGAPG